MERKSKAGQTILHGRSARIGVPTIVRARWNLARNAVMGCWALWLCVGCQLQPGFVPVREAIYRTEVSTTNRLTLPLSAADQAFVLEFLKSGRNPTLDDDGTIADGEAPVRYGGLLELLSRPDQLQVTNLVADETFRASACFRPWYPERALRQIVDAHEDWPLARQPYAFRDRWKRHWWIFYHQRKRLTHLMVTRAIEPEKQR